MKPIKVNPFFIFVFVLLNSYWAWGQDFDGEGAPAEEAAPVSERLDELEPYSNIAVIQKKFFPKTDRWEFFISGLGSLNNKMFTSLGAKAHLSYHFNERWAIEGQVWYLGQITKDLTENLENNYQIKSNDLVTPQGFVGLNLVWSPVYGKLSLFEKTINPFELYFSVGGGVILTEDSQSAPALQLAFGQIHPLSTQMTLRWEVGGNIFRAEGQEDLVGSDRGKKLTAEIIYVSLGVSFYFPEVESR